ncbi:MAG: hypothetical protein E1N59_2898 [Puniceicoccaceae bacterium 5H]|nr:MAG: hypothetical protein E1N59_2898 [Puniceicoccaceae bacterium 5H]
MIRRLPVTLTAVVVFAVLWGALLAVTLRERTDCKIQRYRIAAANHHLRITRAWLDNRENLASIEQAEAWYPQVEPPSGDWEIRWLQVQRTWRAQLERQGASVPGDWGLPESRQRAVRKAWLAEAEVLYPRVWQALPVVPELSVESLPSRPEQPLRTFLWQARFTGETPDLGRLALALATAPVPTALVDLEVQPVDPEPPQLEPGRSEFVVTWLTLFPEEAP